jgi:hypothetical protein
MSLQLFCGEALCKKPITLPPGSTAWPLACPACGTPLYPKDVLDRLPDRHNESKPAALMTVRGGARVAVTSTDLGAASPGSAAAATRPSAAATDPTADVDRLLAMVELDPQATAPAPAPVRGASLKRTPALLLGAAVLLVVIALAVLASR